MENEIVKQETGKPEWWENTPYQDAVNIINTNKKTLQRSIIAIGYYLKSIRDKKQYQEEGFGNIWELAESKFGFSPSTASRYMSINDQFSKDGNSPVIADQYKEYNKMQLTEMLTLTDEQRDQVTPDMKRDQIRAIRKQDAHPELLPEEQIPGQDSIMNHPEVVPDDEPLPDKESCIKEFWDKFVPEEIKLALKAENHNDFKKWLYSSKTMNWTEMSFGTVHGNNINLVFCDKYKNILYQVPWYGVHAAMIRFARTYESADNSVDHEGNHSDAPAQKPEKSGITELTNCIHRDGFGCSLPLVAQSAIGDGISCNQKCCWNCENHGSCGYECNASAHRPEAEKVTGEVVIENPEEDAQEVVPEDELQKTKKLLEGWREDLREVLALPEDAQKKIEKICFERRIVCTALSILVDMMERDQIEAQTEEQPGLPKFRNDDERKKWLENYKSWGLWYRDENIDVNYYKYDFSDGTRLVVDEYNQREDENNPVGHKYDLRYYHLMRKGQKKYNRTGTFDKKYMHNGDSITYLVGYLKELQK